MHTIQGLNNFLQQPRQVVIVTHHKPDADALGSSLGLCLYLKKKGHNPRVMAPSDYPEFLHWMPGNSDVFVLQKNNEPQAAALIERADIVFCLDFSSLSRINSLGDIVRASSARKALIDHHLEPEHFADFEKWEPTAASTAELVYELICQLGDKEMIDKQIAECLYAGLMTDTGGFRHSNTTKKVFQVASDLTGLGAEPARVSKLIYDNNSLDRLRLMGFVLSQKLTVLPQYRTAYIALSVNDLKSFGSQTGDTEGLVNYGLSIKGVRLAALIHERKEHVKLSFRSLGNFSVNEFARKHFEGGGHKNASGGQSNLSLNETVTKFLDLLESYKDELNDSAEN